MRILAFFVINLSGQNLRFTSMVISSPQHSMIRWLRLSKPARISLGSLFTFFILPRRCEI